MSSRQLRKLQKHEELQKAKLTEQSEEVTVEEESEDEPILPTKPKASLFASLAALEAEEDESQLAEDDEDDVAEESHQAPAPPITPKKAKKSKNKKAKAKKGKEKALEVEDHTGDSEDIDAVLKDLALKDSVQQPTTKQTTKLPVDPEYERICALLSIGSQHLKVANEMRDIYGKDFSTAEPTENNGQGTRGNRPGQRQPQEVDLETALKGRHLPGKGLTATTFRRNALIEGKQHWPNSTTGGLGSTYLSPHQRIFL